MKVSSKWFLRFQARYSAWYVVCGLTPVKFATCPMFFADKADALKALHERGYELVEAGGEELRKIASTLAACLLLALLGGALQACSMEAAPALERCDFEPTATYQLAGDFGTVDTTIANYVAKCAALEQIHVTCAGNVLTVRDRAYTEIWTLEAPEHASVNVLAPGVDELYSVTLRRRRE